ncbi:DUF4352 domain-containing protein [Streptomyces sp. NPDC001922]|uniref:DUF4352 domain-containing protein n=1 Tax=Streptomyces sp. NPDC001922 TaxID=3364624 RepID=UPI00369963CC
MNTRTTTATAGLVAAAFLLTACTGLSRTAAPDTRAAPEGTGTAGGAGANPSPGSAAGYQVGENARNGNLIVKVRGVYEADAIAVVGGTKSPGAGARYVGVEIVVRNGTKAALGLTCPPHIADSLVDDRGRRYDVIDDLDEIPGNPQCGERLRPGAKKAMVLAYRVPKSAKIAAWEFSDSGREPSTVALRSSAAR